METITLRVRATFLISSDSNLRSGSTCRKHGYALGRLLNALRGLATFRLTSALWLVFTFRVMASQKSKVIHLKKQRSGQVRIQLGWPYSTTRVLTD